MPPVSDGHLFELEITWLRKQIMKAERSLEVLNQEIQMTLVLSTISFPSGFEALYLEMPLKPTPTLWPAVAYTSAPVVRILASLKSAVSLLSTNSLENENGEGQHVHIGEVTGNVSLSSVPVNSDYQMTIHRRDLSTTTGNISSCSTQRQYCRNNRTSIALASTENANTVPYYNRRQLIYQPIKIATKRTLAHRMTVYAVFTILTIGSAVTICIAALKAKHEKSIGTNSSSSSLTSNFFGSISQSLESILAVFCMLVPLIERNRELQSDIAASYPKTFRWLLFLSILMAVLSAVCQRTDEAGSLVYGYVSMASQLVATLLLVIGSTRKITRFRADVDNLSTRHMFVSMALFELHRRTGVPLTSHHLHKLRDHGKSQ